MLALCLSCHRWVKMCLVWQMTALDTSALLQFHQQLISLCLCVVKSEEVLMFSYPHMTLFSKGKNCKGILLTTMLRLRLILGVKEIVKFRNTFFQF